jgi:hypothetical protein
LSTTLLTGMTGISLHMLSRMAEDQSSFYGINVL